MTEMPEANLYGARVNLQQIPVVLPCPNLLRPLLTWPGSLRESATHAAGWTRWREGRPASLHPAEMRWSAIFWEKPLDLFSRCIVGWSMGEAITA